MKPTDSTSAESQQREIIAEVAREDWRALRADDATLADAARLWRLVENPRALLAAADADSIADARAAKREFFDSRRD